MCVFPVPLSETGGHENTKQSGQWQLARQLLESMLDSPQSVKGLDTAAKDDRRGRKTKKDGTYMGLSSDVVRQLRLFVGGAEEAGSGAILGETAALTAAGMKIPRPDGISFHVVLKALLNASRWTDAMEVLTKMNDEQ